jgi:hypothetical protein
MKLNVAKFERRIPFVSLFPLGTLVNRLLWKWKLSLTYFGFYGAKEIDIKSNGNVQIRLNRQSILGNKGTTLEVPLDFSIFNAVRVFGEWSQEVSNFLAAGLMKNSSENEAAKTVLLDIGANSGLITLQTLNRIDKKSTVILFEPVANHREAIEYNLRGQFSKHEIIVNGFALGQKNAQTTFFREKK